MKYNHLSQKQLNKSINNITMVFEEESTSVSPVDIEGFTLLNKSPLSCPPGPPVSLSPSRVATSAGSPLPSLTQAQAFSLNKNSTLCLPVFSADNKLLWVHSNSIAQEVAHAADTLDRAFDVFPYPKREEMAKLARRCSLHLDHVRVWFMFQRLHYGISWDSTDICKVRRRLLGPGRRRPAKAAVVVGGEDDPQAVRELGEEKEEAEEEEETARKDVLEDGRPRKKKKKTPYDLLPKGIPLASKGHRGPPGAGENHTGRKADSTATVSGDDDGVDGVTPGNGSAHGNTSALGDLDTSKAKASHKNKNKNKTRKQLEQLEQLNHLRRSFLACQYPEPSDYDRLSELTGRQRQKLAQWFADRRYDLKNSEPRWITRQDQQQVLARMRHQQRVRHLWIADAGLEKD